MKSHAVKMERKTKLLEAIRDRFDRSSIAILTDYRGDGSGMTVKEISELRDKLRESGGEYCVVKNSLAKKACAEHGIEGLDGDLAGPTAIAVGYDDPSGVAKALLEFAKEHKEKGIPQFRSGYMDGKILAKEEVQALADLPSLPQLQTQLLGLMLAPHRNILGVVNAPGRQVAQLMEAWRAKQEEGGGN